MNSFKISSVIRGCGGYLPEKILTNNDLPEELNTSHEWIFQRTGIRQRHIAAEGELTSDMALQAAAHALDAAKILPKDIDLIICATTSPDRTFPATATRLQALLGIENAAAFDVQAVCAGFLYALTLADHFIRVGNAQNVLVVGADVFSRLVDWNDRNTCVLFGDGAGAVVLSRYEGNGRGILGSFLQTDGRLIDILCSNGGPGLTGHTGVIQMNGKEVFRHAIQKMSDAAETILMKHNFTVKDIDWFVPHQANHRILSAVAEKLNIPEDKLIVTVGGQANTSAASIPLALFESQSRFKEGDLILLDALGAGLAWGAVLLRW